MKKIQILWKQILFYFFHFGFIFFGIFRTKLNLLYYRERKKQQQKQTIANCNNLFSFFTNFFFVMIYLIKKKATNIDAFTTIFYLI